MQHSIYGPCKKKQHLSVKQGTNVSEKAVTVRVVPTVEKEQLESFDVRDQRSK